MVFTCCVVGSNERAGRDKVSFYRISAVMQHQEGKTAASSSKRRHDWVKKLNRKLKEWRPTKNSRVCAGHSFQVNQGNSCILFAFAVYMDRIRAAIRRVTKLSSYVLEDVLIHLSIR